jgi:uncharacterized protein YycO
MKRKKISLTVILSVIITLAVTSISFYSGDHKARAELTIVSDLLKIVDIIFRKGRGFVTEMVLLADGQSPYSHTGIISINENSVHVIHAVPDESENGIDYIKNESLSNFLNHAKTESAIVYRLKQDSTETAIKAAKSGEEYYNRRLLFDSALDLETDDKLYCTELVWKAFRSAGIDLIDGRFNHLNTPIHNGIYIFPSSLLGSKYLTQITTTKQEE